MRRGPGVKAKENGLAKSFIDDESRRVIKSFCPREKTITFSLALINTDSNKRNENKYFPFHLLPH